MLRDMIYAGVGSRQTPSETCESMTSIAYQMAASKWQLRSGYADGADKAFGMGAAQQSEESGEPERYTMYLPWSGFNKAPVGDSRFKVVTPTDELYTIARACHPAWSILSEPAKLLMIRNVAIVAGLDLGSPAACLICWTKDASRYAGGTGHAVRVAEHFRVPIFNLASAYDQRAVVEFINGYEQMMENIPF